MPDFLLSLSANIAWAALGAGLLQFVRFFSQTRPTRRLWRLRHPNDLVVSVATSSQTFTGSYNRPATGIGQLKAMALISASLRKAYRKAPVTNIVFSHEQIQKKIESDLIILGGPKNNKVSEKFIAEFDLFDQLEGAFRWRADEDERFFHSEIKDGVVKVDYGMILQGRNPFAENGTYISLFSGLHTYGTIAAARYFTETYVKQPKVESSDTILLCLVKCEVMDEYPVKLELIQKKEIVVKK